MEKEAGQLAALRERYRQAAVTSWQTVRQQREEYGDPADLPNLLEEIQRDLVPITERLELTTPQAAIAELERSLATARRAQPTTTGRLEKKIGRLGTLEDRYEHAAVTSWQPIHQRKEEIGDPASLPAL